MAPVTSITANPSTAPAVVTPTAPRHLPAAAQQKWTAAYAKALAQAQRDYPENERAQRTVALKAANALMSVAAPTSAADIDGLENWQVLIRGSRSVKQEGVDVRLRTCVTTDGRKYSFPVEPPVEVLDSPSKRSKSGE